MPVVARGSRHTAGKMASAKLKISSPPTSYENDVLKINFTVSSQKCGRIIKISFRAHKFEPAKCGKIGNFADPVYRINFIVSSQTYGRIFKIYFRPHEIEPAKCGKNGNLHFIFQSSQ
jgi:hypothetical protein